MCVCVVISFAYSLFKGTVNIFGKKDVSSILTINLEIIPCIGKGQQAAH